MQTDWQLTGSEHSGILSMYNNTSTDTILRQYPYLYISSYFLHIDSPRIHGLRNLDKIRATSGLSMDMEHVSIAGTWTEILKRTGRYKIFSSPPDIFSNGH